MNNIELCEKISAYLKGSKTKAKKIKDLVAVHFNLLDVSENMYIEIKEGVLAVMPYEYNDRQAAVTASTETLDKLFSGAMTFDAAMADGFVQVEGDVEKFKVLSTLVAAEKKAASKPAAKKPAAKKAEPKKCATKCAKADKATEAKAETKAPAAKAEAKAPAAKTTKAKK